MTVAASDPRKPASNCAVAAAPTEPCPRRPTVRWTDADGTRRRRKFDTFEEADLERARLALELAQTGTIGGVKDNTLAALWPVYRADAVARLAKATIISYDRCWSRHLAPRFGDMPMDEITPRSVAQWRADMLARASAGRSSAARWCGYRPCSPSESSGVKPSATRCPSCASLAKAAFGPSKSSTPRLSNASVARCWSSILEFMLSNREGFWRD
jgi:hypothetical protein